MHVVFGRIRRICACAQALLACPGLLGHDSGWLVIGFRQRKRDRSFDLRDLLRFGMKTFRLVAINVLIFFALLAGLELFFRVKGPSANATIEQPNGMQLHVLPYVMFANEAYSR